MKISKPILDAMQFSHVDFESAESVQRIEEEIHAKKLFPTMDTLPQKEPSFDEEQQVDCTYCGKVHELKRSMWLAENARLIELKVSGFYYCADLNKVFITE